MKTAYDCERCGAGAFSQTVRVVTIAKSILATLCMECIREFDLRDDVHDLCAEAEFILHASTGNLWSSPGRRQEYVDINKKLKDLAVEFVMTKITRDKPVLNIPQGPTTVSVIGPNQFSTLESVKQAIDELRNLLVSAQKNTQNRPTSVIPEGL